MDNLDIDVRNADALGLSYGQYKALHYDPNANVTKRGKKSVKLCPVCGDEVTNPRRKCCSDACSKVRERETRRNWAHKRYHELREKGGERSADS
jgi:hypothetical protein